MCGFLKAHTWLAENFTHGKAGHALDLQGEKSPVCVGVGVGVSVRGGNRRQKRSYLDSGTPSVRSTPFGSKFVDHC